MDDMLEDAGMSGGTVKDAALGRNRDKRMRGKLDADICTLLVNPKRSNQAI